VKSSSRVGAWPAVSVGAWERFSGGFEVEFFALVSPHSSPLPSPAFLLGGEASNRAFEDHRQVGNGAAALLSSRVLFNLP
jgi:hypothetical protein